MKTGVTHLELLDALSIVHKMGDIETRVRDDTIHYRTRRLKTRPTSTLAPSRYVPTAEELAEDEVALEDFINNCPFISDRERVLYRTPVKDWDEDDHFLMDNGAEYDLYMERKYSPMVWKRMKEERATSDIV